MQQSSYRNADSTVHNRDDVFNSTRTSTAKGVYNTWKSRKVVNLQPSNHIDQAYLPSIAFNRKLQHVYDIVIIATPIVQCDTLAGSVAMEKSVEENAPVTSKDAEKTTLFGTRKKVIPSRKAEPGVSLPSYSLVESGGGDEGSSHLQNEVNVNAADYNSAAKSAGESTGDHDHHYNQVCDEEDVYPPGSSDAPSVQKEAYFFRINAESYAKRHQAAKTDITGTSNGSRKTRSSSTKARERTKSKKDINALVASSVMYSNTDDDVSVRKVGDQKTDENDLLSRTLLSADDKYAPKSSVFMRSRPIQLDCAMQLFQVQSGVYNRITLYGMEGFRLENIVPEQGEGSAQNSASDNMQNMQCIAQPDDINHNIDNNVEPLQQRAVPGNTSSSPSTTSSVQNNSNTLSTLAATSGERPGADCIICLSNKQTTIMFPCRHLCLCAECAKTIATRATASVDRANNRETVQEKKCPVCRKPVIVMFQLK